MCTPHEASMIRQEAGQWIQRGKMFTSVDIANSLKQRGFWIKNREVAAFLRQGVVGFSPQYGYQYTKTIINVTLPNGSNTEAALYHPMGTDPNDYEKTDQRALSPDEAQADNPTDGHTPFDDDDPCAGCDGCDQDDDYGSDEDEGGMRLVQGAALRATPNQVVNIYISNVHNLFVSPSTPEHVASHSEMENYGEGEEDYDEDDEY